MIIKVIVNGAKGRMGKMAVNAINADPALSCIAETDKHDNLSDIIAKTNAQVVVDLTHADVVYDNTKTIINAGAHPVIGSSGLTEKQVAELQALSHDKKLGGIIAPNFSLGAVLMMRYAQDAAKYLPDVEIIELHHPQKLDAPSGTAIKTADMIAATRQQTPRHASPHENIKGSRGAHYKNIPIHAVRLPGFVASQEVILGGASETLRIQHQSIDRQCFMPGILLACKKVINLHSLVYGLEHML